MVGLVTTIPWFRFQPRVVGSNGCRWLLPSWHLAAIWQLPPMQAELEVRPGSRTEREPISASQHLVDVAQPLVGRKRPMPPPVVRCQPLRLGFGTRCTDHQDGGVAGGRTGAQDRNGDERRRFPSCPTTALLPSLARACGGRWIFHQCENS